MSSPVKSTLTIDPHLTSKERNTPPTPKGAFTPSQLSHTVSAPNPMAADRVALLKNQDGKNIVVPLDSPRGGAITISASFSNYSKSPEPEQDEFMQNGSNSAPLPHRNDAKKTVKLATHSEEEEDDDEENWEEFNGTLPASVVKKSLGERSGAGTLEVTAIEDLEDLDKLFETN